MEQTQNPMANSMPNSAPTPAPTPAPEPTPIPTPAAATAAPVSSIPTSAPTQVPVQAPVGQIPGDMKDSGNMNVKIVLGALAVVVVLIAGYFAFRYFSSSSAVDMNTSGINGRASDAIVEGTPTVNGVLTVPVGLPEGLPIEEGNIVESVSTEYIEHNARQINVSYISAKTEAEVYDEYKKYVSENGYEVSEGDPSSAVRSITGKKENANLSVTVSTQEEGTLIQISYLMKKVFTQ